MFRIKQPCLLGGVQETRTEETLHFPGIEEGGRKPTKDNPYIPTGGSPAGKAVTYLHVMLHKGIECLGKLFIPSRFANSSEFPSIVVTRQLAHNHRY